MGVTFSTYGDDEKFIQI